MCEKLKEPLEEKDNVEKSFALYTESFPISSFENDEENNEEFQEYTEDEEDINKIEEDSNFQLSGMQSFMKDVNQYPLLSAEEEIELFKKYKNGDMSARKKILNSNLRLLLYVAEKFHPYTEQEKLDYIQDGYIGLDRAVDLYDYTLGYRFSTYAYNWISSKISRNKGKTGYPVALDSHQEEILIQIKKAVNQYYEETGKNPTRLEEIRPLLKTKSGDAVVESIWNYYNTKYMSLDAPVSNDGSDDGTDFGDVLNIAGQDNSPEDEIIKKIAYQNLKSVIDTCLTKKEKEIIMKRYGFETGTPQTLDEISQYYHVSKQAINQQEIKILRKLRMMGGYNLIKINEEICGKQRNSTKTKSQRN